MRQQRTIINLAVVLALFFGLGFACKNGNEIGAGPDQLPSEEVIKNFIVNDIEKNQLNYNYEYRQITVNSIEITRYEKVYESGTIGGASRFYPVIVKTSETRFLKEYAPEYKENPVHQVNKQYRCNLNINMAGHWSVSMCNPI